MSTDEYRRGIEDAVRVMENYGKAIAGNDDLARMQRATTDALLSLVRAFLFPSPQPATAGDVEREVEALREVEKATREATDCVRCGTYDDGCAVCRDSRTPAVADAIRKLDALRASKAGEP